MKIMKLTDVHKRKVQVQPYQSVKKYIFMVYKITSGVVEAELKILSQPGKQNFIQQSDKCWRGQGKLSPSPYLENDYPAICCNQQNTCVTFI